MRRMVIRLAVLLFAAPALRPSVLFAQCPDGSAPPCRIAPRATAPVPNTVAVLYFENSSRDSDDAYLADGLTEDIIARLGQIERLRVASRFAVRRYRDSSGVQSAALGRALGVAHLVSGSIRRVSNQLVVSVELLRAATGLQLWTQQFDRSDSNLLAIEQDISQAVVTAIAGRLLPAERAAVAVRPTRSTVAYDHYLRGNFFIAQRRAPAARRAVEEYTRAAEADPGFTQAWARLAKAYLLFPIWEWTLPGVPQDSLIARGIAATDRALRLDSTSGDAWMARGTVLTFTGPSLAASIPALQRAVTLDPKDAEAWHALGFALEGAGRPGEAGSAFERALALEPLRAVSLGELSRVRLVEGRLDEAQRLVDSAIAVEPTPYFYARAVQVHLLAGDTAGARVDAAAADSASRGDDPLWGLVAQATLAAVLHDTAAALRDVELLRQDGRGVALLSAAITLTQLGARDAAIALLEQARRRFPFFWFLQLVRGTPEVASLRDDVRFQRLLEEGQPE
jgi:TolB-like protein/Tfp pilus assembly protein PilF